VIHFDFPFLLSRTPAAIFRRLTRRRRTEKAPHKTDDRDFVLRHDAKHHLRPDPIIDGYCRSDGVDIWSRLRQIDRMELGGEILVPLEIGLITFGETGRRIGAFGWAHGKSLSRCALLRLQWRDRR
jgi:hypothetical protein